MESLKIGQMELATPILAAATSATARLDDLRALNRSAIGAIISKSATLEARAGNPETNYFSDGHLTINAQGLPGPDLDGTMSMLEAFKKERLKPLILSIAGLKPTEYYEIIDHIRLQIGHLFDAVELNLSCPNVAGKSIISYDHSTAIAILEEVLANFPQLAVGVKLAPHFSKDEEGELVGQIYHYLQANLPGYQVSFENAQHFDRDHLVKFAQMLQQLSHRHHNLTFVSATNTMPNCRLTRPDGKTVLHPQANSGKGGLSGEFLRAISIENVRALRQHLSDDIKIIGTGGVQNAETAQQYFQAGADAVAIGTGLVNHGPRLVENIIINL